MSHFRPPTILILFNIITTLALLARQPRCLPSFQQPMPSPHCDRRIQLDQLGDSDLPSCNQLFHPANRRVWDASPVPCPRRGCVSRPRGEERTGRRWGHAGCLRGRVFYSLTFSPFSDAGIICPYAMVSSVLINFSSTRLTRKCIILTLLYR
jgi:hypothetical protein